MSNLTSGKLGTINKDDDDDDDDDEDLFNKLSMCTYIDSSKSNSTL